MAIEKFIPMIWSETLYTQLDKQYIAVANSNREFEADIKEKGAVIRVCGVGSVAVNEYYKDTDMSTPQTLSDTSAEIIVNQAKYFNFQIDDIDKAQCSPKLMSAAMKVAADALANDADSYVYGLYRNAGSEIKVDNTSVDNIIDVILKARRKLYEHNVSDSNDIVIEVSPAVAELILKAKINMGTDNSAALENGCIGTIGGCKIFVSNNIHKDSESVSGTTFYKCIARTKRAVSFVEQISEISAYRPEKRFADAVKGLYLYGAKVMYTNEMILLDLGIQD